MSSAGSVRISGIGCLFACILLGWSCGDGTPSSAVECVPNRARPCSCPNGETGRQVCGPDGLFGRCSCLTDGSDTGAGEDAGDGGFSPDVTGPEQCPVTTQAGEEIFVSADRSDPGAGTRDDPTTPTDGLGEASPGDTVTFLAGTYEFQFSPNKSGENRDPIVLRSATPGAAKIRRETGPVFVFDDVAHYRLEGFSFRPGAGRWIHIRESDHIVLSELRLVNYDGTAGAAPLLIEDSRDFELRDSTVRRSRGAHTARIVDSRRFAIRGNDFTMAARWPLTIEKSRIFEVRANVFHNVVGPNLRTTRIKRGFIEHNLFTNAVDGPGTEGAYNVYSGRRSTFRYNRFFRNWATPMRVQPREPRGSGNPTSHTQVYNNVFDDIRDRGRGVGAAFEFERDPGKVFNQRFFNNVFTRVGTSSGRPIQLVTSEFSGYLRLRGNVFWTGNGKEPKFKEGSDVVGLSKFELETEGFVADNRDMNPEFRDLSSYNHRLAAESPLIDLAQPLTETNRSGMSDNVVPVGQHQFFAGAVQHPGRPDLIAVGSEDRTGRITEFRWDNGDLKVVLDRDVSWSDGEPVALAWKGNGADVGAWEVGSTTRPMVGIRRSTFVARVGEPVVFRPVVSGGLNPRLYQWRFGDGSVQCGRSLTHTFREPGDYAVRLAVTDNDGRVYRGTGYVLVRSSDVDPTSYSEYNRMRVDDYLCVKGSYSYNSGKSGRTAVSETSSGGLTCVKP